MTDPADSHTCTHTSRTGECGAGPPLAKHDAEAPSAPDGPGDGSASRGQPPLVRLTKSQKKVEARKRYRMKKRARQKETRREKRIEQREQRKQLLEGMTEEERAAFLEDEKRQKEALEKSYEGHLAAAYESGTKVVFNCSFMDQMSDKEKSSLAKQLSYAYNAMKTSDPPVRLQMHVTSFDKGGELWQRMLHFGAEKWKMHYHEGSAWDVFSLDDIVVLSPDAQEELECVDESKVYVIGGLVDRSIAKYESWSQAQQYGLPCRKLPFTRYIKENLGTVLNVNTVVEVLIRYLQTKDWEHALTASVPQRKQTNIGKKAVKLQTKRERKEYYESLRRAGVDVDDPPGKRPRLQPTGGDLEDDHREGDRTDSDEDEDDELDEDGDEDIHVDNGGQKGCECG
ncbi:unnamed protein product [Vitrella brassicaformis CCMP3155]|uniref:tRNA (guanine(9)-N(1))-methyltransferase n=1 Tax=Vitrella brassicaformis (strain CCMP3155) TaxID=1169540 RepID=A0A0G4H4Q9_VITBC|nr:unnamed protein product [Vitrella brassicaformis CCMP3155]|eukprot:CEM38534.1 unnamed protein product [Vitrella brassicaformis CCMP3155]